MRAGAFGNAVALSCRECGARQELGALYACPECFGPLEVALRPRRDVTREQLAAGPQNIWRYQPLLPVPTDVAEFPSLDPGMTRLVRADNLGPRAGDPHAVGQGRLRQPHPLVQGPGGGGRAHRRA